MNVDTTPDHFFAAIEHCISIAATPAQALVAAKGYSNRGKIDASEGAAHYAMRMMHLTSDTENQHA